MSIRIGGVPYGVGAPLVSGLPAAAGELGLHCDLRKGTPAELIDALRGGALDAALVSSIEGFRRPGYAAPGDLGIACNGAVRSVRAFVRRGQPIRTAAVDRGSATSVALLQILLARVLHAEPVLTAIAPTLQPDARSEDLVLLIGDAGRDADPGRREVLDLGTLWRQWTGLPFVFALWLIAPGADRETIVALLRRARLLARRQGTADGTHGATHYDLEPRDHHGLVRFHAEAAELGLCERTIAPTFLPADRTARNPTDA